MFVAAPLCNSLFAAQHMAPVLLQVVAAGSSAEGMLSCTCGRANSSSSSSIHQPFTAQLMTLLLQRPLEAA